ncbi:MAG TPA: glycosyltransferase, partial [Archangium sp.]
EAAAMRKPVITTRVPGCIDSVEDGVTGSLVNVNDPHTLADAMERYASDRNLRESHGRAGRARVERAFSRERIAQAMLSLYARELAGV